MVRQQSGFVWAVAVGVVMMMMVVVDVRPASALTTGSSPTPETPAVFAESGSLVFFDPSSGRVPLRQLLDLIAALNATVQAQASTIASFQESLSACCPASTTTTDTTSDTTDTTETTTETTTVTTTLTTTTTAITTTAITTTVTTTTPNPLTLLWTRLIGDSFNDQIFGLATDSADNVYAVGSTTSTSFEGVTVSGSEDAFLVKYDSSGAKQWTRVIGNTGVEVAYGVAVDSEGNIFVAGYTTSATLNGNSNVGGNDDAFLAKFSSAGDRQWTRLIGGTSAEFAYGVAIDSAGDVFIVGQTNSATLDGNTNAGSSDAFLAKFNTAGTKQWTRLLGGSSGDGGRSVAVDSSGNLYITGSTLSSTLDSNANSGSSSNDAFLAKFDNSGTKQWTRLIGGANDDRGMGVATVEEDIVYVTGYTYSASLDGISNAGSNDAFLARFDSAGTKEWTRLLGGSGAEFCNGIATDSAGFIYITGYTSSATLDGIAKAGGNDAFLAEYDSSGALLLTRLVGTAVDELGQAVATDSAGNVYIGGSTSGNLDGNINAGSNDGFVVKFD